MHHAPSEENQLDNATFDLALKDGDMLYEQLQAVEGARSRLTMYRRSIKSLPLPPALWDNFQRACSQEVSHHKLGEIIKDDPVLAAAVLRSANSAGFIHTEINDVGRAISRLGLSMVRSIVAKHSFSSHHKTSSEPTYPLSTLWKHGMAVSALAEIIAQQIPQCNPDEAGTIGLFHDVGRMGFNLINEFIQPAELDIATGHLIYEYQRFGCTHIDMGMLLAEHWQLPEKIMMGIQYHHHPAYVEVEAIPDHLRAEVLAVYLADLLAIRLGSAGGNPGTILPHPSFAAMLPHTTLTDLANDRRISHEIAMIQEMKF